MGEEGKAAPDVNPVTAPEVLEVSVCGAGCRVAGTAVADPEVSEVGDSTAGGSVTLATGAALGAGADGSVAWAAGAASGAGMLFGATTMLSGFFADTCVLTWSVLALLAPAAFDAAATIAEQIRAVLETIRR